MRDYGAELLKRTAYIARAVKKAGADGIIYGNSGGKDSALVGILSKKAGVKVLGVIMPCGNLSVDAEDGAAIADNFGIEYRTVGLGGVKQALVGAIGDLTKGGALNNIAPRLRMTTLYALAAENNYLVAGTGNLSEVHMGYFTKWGDGAYDINPIADLTVTEIYEFLSYLNAGERILTKAPSAGLFEGQTDEREMGVTYSEIDTYLKGGKVSEQAKAVIDRWHNATQHKRTMPSKYPED